MVGAGDTHLHPHEGHSPGTEASRHGTSKQIKIYTREPWSRLTREGPGAGGETEGGREAGVVSKVLPDTESMIHDRKNLVRLDFFNIRKLCSEKDIVKRMKG